MSSRKEKKRKKLFYIFLCFFVFGIGYYFLNEVSTWYNVPLGVTFHVVFGCTLMAISGIYIGYTINQLYFTKRVKRSKKTYLDDNANEKAL